MVYKRLVFYLNVTKHFFSSYFDQKEKIKQFWIFDKNRALTPLKKCKFFDVLKFILYGLLRPTNGCFLSKTLPKNVFILVYIGFLFIQNITKLFLFSTKIIKNWNFRQKPWKFFNILKLTLYSLRKFLNFLKLKLNSLL